MKFHLEFDIKKLSKPIQHEHRLLLIGSCFTENIGEKLTKHKFNVLENPHGILFNPVSVVEALDAYIQNKTFTENDLFLYNETWHSWKHHSRFSGITQHESLEKINKAINEAHHWLRQADFLIITLGSAWVYHLTEKAANAVPDSVAANNHKAPADWFRKALLSADATQSMLEKLVQRLQIFNPNLQVLFTISPVRHLREGMIGNNRSKAVLIQAVHQLIEYYDRLHYFPAYELVMDDLRDYRFYAEDMVHPNYQATQYVWEKLTESCMNEETRQLMKELADIQLAYQHKPFNDATEKHLHFLRNYLEKTLQLSARYEFLNFEKEIAYFRSGLSSLAD